MLNIWPNGRLVVWPTHLALGLVASQPPGPGNRTWRSARKKAKQTGTPKRGGTWTFPHILWMEEILHQLIGCLTHYYKVSTIQGGAWLNFSTHSKPQHVFMNGCFMICWSDSCCILGMGWGFDQTAPREQQPSQCVDFGGGSWRPESWLHLMIIMWP